jgi:hypothetical protein
MTDAELSKEDVYQFCRDITSMLFHESVDTGRVKLNEETPLMAVVIYNSVVESMGYDDITGQMVVFEDQHDDELLEEYDVPVRKRSEWK